MSRPTPDALEQALQALGLQPDGTVVKARGYDLFRDTTAGGLVAAFTRRWGAPPSHYKLLRPSLILLLDKHRAVGAGSPRPNRKTRQGGRSE